MVAYPVKVMAIDLDWIIDPDEGDTDGFEFLEAIYSSTNLEFFNVPAIKILIEFLYSEFRKKILSTRLPFYIF